MSSGLPHQQLWLPEAFRSHTLQQQCGGLLEKEEQDPKPEEHDQEAA